jgi:hypothetical protein
MLTNKFGSVGFVHPDGVYDDPAAGHLRRALYPRLRYHFQFENELNLFVGTNDHGRMRFGISVYGEPMPVVHFTTIGNLFWPSTIDASFAHDGHGACGGIKTEADEWNVEGHSNRVVKIEELALALFARLYDEPNTKPLEARLPSLHANDLLSVLRKFVDYPSRLVDSEESLKSSVLWDETAAVIDRTILRDTGFARSPSDWVLSGPHFSLGNPMSKTARQPCTANSHYDPIDLTAVPGDYLPRTNYRPACDPEIYRARTTSVHWNSTSVVTDFYRFASREMLNQGGERTLLCCILPKEVGHINTVFSVSFSNLDTLLDFTSLALSLPVDFFVKTTGVGHTTKALTGQIPVWTGTKLPSRLRTLLLNCLTVYYADIWLSMWNESFRSQRWTKIDSRLDNARFTSLSPEWRWDTPLRTDYERRQALVEIDVLAARSLGLTLDELRTIYRIQFPVLQQNERDTWYDQRGRIVFTCSKGVPGVGFTRPEWEGIKTMTSGVVTRTVQDDTLPGGPRERVIEYVAPFDRCDREADYTTAWKFFEENGE